MVFDYTGGTDPVATIQGLLNTSYAGGAWNVGKFLNTTKDLSHGLGWIDNTGASQVKVAYTFYGDASLDGTVDATDLARVLNNYNQGPIVPGILVGVLDAKAIQMLTAAGFTVVPEPSTLVLLTAGLLGLLCYAWRRRRS